MTKYESDVRQLGWNGFGAGACLVGALECRDSLWLALFLATMAIINALAWYSLLRKLGVRRYVVAGIGAHTVTLNECPPTAQQGDILVQCVDTSSLRKGSVVEIADPTTGKPR